MVNNVVSINTVGCGRVQYMVEVGIRLEVASGAVYFTTSSPNSSSRWLQCMLKQFQHDIPDPQDPSHT